MAFLGFWASHIFFTIFIDGQVVVPQLFPPLLKEFLAWYCACFKDPLMSQATITTPQLLWFRAMVSCEMCFQLPFFIVAVRMLLLSNHHHHHHHQYPNWFRYACIAYGSHTATTMAPILATLLINNPDATLPERILITALYLPYLIFPLWILRLAVQDDNNDDHDNDDNNNSSTSSRRKSKPS